MNTDPIFGLPLDAPTLVCLVLGIVIIAALSMNKFNEPTVAVDADLTAQLLPRYLANTSSTRAR